MDIDGGDAGVEAVKMRTKDDGGRMAVKLVDSAAQVQALLEHFTRAVPEPAAVQPGLRKVNKSLARQGPAFGGAERRKTQGQIDLHHVPARQHHPVKNMAQAGAQPAHQWQRQWCQQPHESDAGMRAQTAQ